MAQVPEEHSEVDPAEFLDQENGSASRRSSSDRRSRSASRSSSSRQKMKTFHQLRSKGCLKRMATISIFDCNYHCHHKDNLSIKSKSSIFIRLVVMLLMTKYSNEFFFQIWSPFKSYIIISNVTVFLDTLYVNFKKPVSISGSRSSSPRRGGRYVV